MSESLWLLLGIGCFVLVLRLATSFLQKKKEQEEVLPYEKETALLTPAEKDFFVVLLEAVSDSYLVFAKVRMSDIVSVPKMENTQYYHFFNKIQSKHIDFLLCDKETTEPILAIELDDSSHKKPRRHSRDLLVNDIFKSANLPILHIPTAQSYEKETISTEIRNVLSIEKVPKSI